MGPTQVSETIVEPYYILYGLNMCLYLSFSTLSRYQLNLDNCMYKHHYHKNESIFSWGLPKEY